MWELIVSSCYRATDLIILFEISARYSTALELVFSTSFHFWIKIMTLSKSTAA